MQPSRPLNVVRASGGKLFFQLFDPELAICRVGFGVAPDVLALPFSTASQTLPKPSSLPREVWQRVHQGRCVVLFDATIDGVPHSPRTSERLHAYLASAGVRPGAALYMTQHRGWGGAYDDYMRRPDVERMRVEYYDYHPRAFFKDFETTGEAAYAERLALFAARQARRSKRYLSPNLTLRATRALMLAQLIRHGLLTAGHISFGGVKPAHPDRRAVSLKFLQQKIAELPGFSAVAAPLAPAVEALAEIEPRMLTAPRRETGAPNGIGRISGDWRFQEYGDSWFSLVTETEMDSRRITENSLRPLVNFHPAIVLGNANSMAFLRGLGFRSFNGYFDEAYDGEADPARRFEMVAREVLRLCALPDEDLWEMERSWAETLIHNARFGMTRMPAVYRERLDLRIVSRIGEMLRAPPHEGEAARAHDASTLMRSPPPRMHQPLPRRGARRARL